LDRWWPASTFHSLGAFYHKGDNPELMLTKQMPRPDGHGLWTEGDRSVPFFLEFDLGSERLEVLTDKVIRYSLLAAMTHWRYPVLFWLPSARRELNLHNLITSTGKPRAVIATAAADLAAQTVHTLADAVWWRYGNDGGRLRLSQLPYRNPHDAEDDEDQIATSYERR
jgi:Replication-relaxation